MTPRNSRRLMPPSWPERHKGLPELRVGVKRVVAQLASRSALTRASPSKRRRVQDKHPSSGLLSSGQTRIPQAPSQALGRAKGAFERKGLLKLNFQYAA